MGHQLKKNSLATFCIIIIKAVEALEKNTNSLVAVD